MSKDDLEALVSFLREAQADWMTERPTLGLLTAKLGDWVARAKASESSPTDSFDPGKFV